VFEPGAFVTEYVSPVDPEGVQPNGVDLTLDAVFRQREPGRIARDGKRIGEREPVTTIDEDAGGRAGDGNDGTEDSGDGDGDADADRPSIYRLAPGGYVARYAETIEIPEGHVGFVYPRSSLMRNSCTIDTAVWDAGYRGRGEGLLEVYHEIEIERGARLAQFVLACADHEGTYEGTYQGENVG
jgi:deoxycytidine triphosphate deaminase